MLRLSLLAALAATCFAQNAEELFNRPAPEVDKALRDRVTEFYGYHISQQYRKAEPLVAEDTKDYFFAAGKPHYLSCEIKQIKYLDDFKRANVTMMCSLYLMMPGFSDKPANMPFGSTWKMEDGKWFWYVDQDALRTTPFGKMTPGPPSAGGGPAPPALPDIPTTADFLYNLVQVDKKEVEVKRGESAQITISNTAPGVMHLDVSSKPAGVEASIDNTSPAANQKSILTIKAGDLAASGKLEIYVLPIKQLIPVQVNVK
jgi:hypothetical protein